MMMMMMTMMMMMIMMMMMVVVVVVRIIGVDIEGLGTVPPKFEVGDGPCIRPPPAYFEKLCFQMRAKIRTEEKKVSSPRNLFPKLRFFW